MAIERVDKAKMEFTPVTLALLGVAGVLTVVALVVFYLAYGNWRFKTELTEGYEAYDRGVPGRAATALKDALGWRPAHRGARELLAKIAVESGNLEEARAHYEALQKHGHDSHRVRVGLGVVALRKADATEEPKQVQELVKLAQDHFKSASGALPEADLGLGHAELLLAARLREPARVDAARKIFEKVRAALDSDAGLRARITRDGLVDYYAGLGRVLSQGAAYDPAAAQAWRACLQYSPRWLVPKAALLALEARRLQDWREGIDGLNR
ncbi:MAG TPA: tetratricopeptide repeat protein, partial [Planctomycetota bacterium]|nr:tetratricopeptide repeat protein [Planctomycetota bacterium]